MDVTEIQYWGKRLHSAVPLLGSFFRANAVEKLAESSNPMAIRFLIGAMKSADEFVRESAGKKLRNLKSQKAIDALCDEWIKRRDEKLGKLIVKCGYVAAHNPKIRVLSALRSGKVKKAGDSAGAIEFLLKYKRHKDVSMAKNSEKALNSLAKQESIDALVAAWMEKFEPSLGELIQEKKYIAATPARMRVYSALISNALEEAADSEESIPWLVEALDHEDDQIRMNAGRVLRSLEKPEVLDAICEAALQDPSGDAARLVKEMDYQHSNTGRQSLVYLLTDRMEEYFDLDFDMSWLKAEYKAADEGLRKRIGNQIRGNGDVRLLKLFRDGKKSKEKREEQLTEAEATIFLDLYKRNKQWNEIFHLMFHMPLVGVVSALDILLEARWMPEDHEYRELLKELIDLRRFVDASATGISDFGLLIAQWIQWGRGQAGRSPENLRCDLKEGNPQQASVALAALATAGAADVNDIKTACNHRHWLVRLTFLALFEFSPQFAFSNATIRREGGDFWMEHFAPSVLEAAGVQCRAGSLNPDQLEGLSLAHSTSIEKSSRWACGRLIEALARHNLRHTIEVDDRAEIVISETAIEVEG